MEALKGSNQASRAHSQGGGSKKEELLLEGGRDQATTFILKDAKKSIKQTLKYPKAEQSRQVKHSNSQE